MVVSALSCDHLSFISVYRGMIQIVSNVLLVDSSVLLLRVYLSLLSNEPIELRLIALTLLMSTLGCLSATHHP